VTVKGHKIKGERSILFVRIQKDLVAKLRAIARERKLSLADLVAELLKNI